MGKKLIHIGPPADDDQNTSKYSNNEGYHQQNININWDNSLKPCPRMRCVCGQTFQLTFFSRGTLWIRLLSLFQKIEQKRVCRRCNATPVHK